MEKIIIKTEKRKSFLFIAKESFKLGWQFQRKHFVWFVVLALLSGSFAFLQFGSFSILVNAVVNYLKTSTDSHLTFFEVVHLFRKTFLLLIAAYLIPTIVAQWQSNENTVFSERFLSSMSNYFTVKQSTLDIATIESADYQNKIQQGNEWGRSSITALLNSTVLSLSSLVAVIVSATALAFIDIRFVLLAIASAVPLYFIEEKFDRELFRVRRLSTGDKRVISNRMAIFMSPVSLIEVVMYGSAKKYQDEVKNLMEEEDVKISKIKLRQTSWQNVARVYAVGCMLIVGILIVLKGANGQMPIGLMVFAFSVYTSFFASATSLFGYLAFSLDSARYAQIWLDIFATQPKIVSKDNAVFLSIDISPKIEFKNVSFAYEGSETNALTNINVVIEPGAKVGIVGLSGAGKTTFIKLLCRIYDPSEGQILVNGIDLKDIDVKNWQQILGVMQQNYGNYNVPISESVAIGDFSKPIDNDKVKWAIEMAGAKQFVEKLPDQYEQLIWKGFKNGTDLSGGERQRLAIARIFYRGAAISILDEPTSSVDALTASMIFENLETKTANKTVLLISHNFSTVKESTNILVIEHGEVIEQGTHDELYILKGRYAELYELQAKSFNDKTGSVKV
ncbi:MAG: ABC transporter ATP-binding protein [Candidatus Paceibacterota bacterium]